MAEKTIDFIALGRVSSRAEFKSIRLAEVSAKCDPKVSGPLSARLENNCEVLGRDGNVLRVLCNYQFSVSVTEVQVAEATVKYLVEYELRGDEPFSDDDISAFAFANGTLHSWPFLREFLNGLTSRMGYQPYMLPVFHFIPKRPPQPAPKAEPATVQELPELSPEEPS